MFEGIYQALMSIAEAIRGSGLWQDYTPTLINLVLGNGTMKARYIKVGKMVTVNIFITFGSTSSYGSGGEWNISLPFPVANNTGATGSAYALDVGIAHKSGIVKTNTTGMRAFKSAEAGTGWNNVVPHTWAAPDYIVWSITYEAA